VEAMDELEKEGVPFRSYKSMRKQEIIDVVLERHTASPAL
jgi:hypothetical protein